MMKVRSLCAVALGAAIAVSAAGETIRPLVTKENKFPEVGRYEVGTLLEMTEMGDNQEEFNLNDANLWMASPYVRYMAAQNLAVQLAVPFGVLDSEVSGSDAGFGDVSVGVEFLAYEHIFRFPYVIPHASLNLGTGDSDTGLGNGETSVLLGTTIGSTMYDESWHFMLDVAYEIFEDSENIATLGGAVILDFSEQFSLLAQGQMTDEDPEGEWSGHPVLLGGGMIYKANERLTLGAYGSAVKNSREDVITTFRISYDI